MQEYDGQSLATLGESAYNDDMSLAGELAKNN